MKYNELQYSPVTTPSPARFIWSDFRVPSWWLDKVPVPYELARTEVNRVTRVDITTPEFAGHGVLILESVTFRGKRFPSTLFYQILLGAWLFFALAILGARAWSYSDTLKEKEKREKELLAVKEALEIKTTKLEDMAQTDPLTGLLNRFGLHAHIKQAMDQAKANPQAGLSVIIADIDFFKKINDTHGHAQGDEVLKQVAQIFGRNTRSHDAVARWGGEEFLILSPMTRLEIAARVAEKLRKMVEQQVPGVTCSFGVAEWREGRGIAEVLQSADTALYRAKREGRNQVQVG
jgi:diguanylate cyclase (GGDEF)-like protein